MTISNFSFIFLIAFYFYYFISKQHALLYVEIHGKMGKLNGNDSREFIMDKN